MTNTTERPITFSSSRRIRCGKHSAKLSATQCSLLSYLCKHGRATYGELRKHVWSRHVSVRAIVNAWDKLGDALSTSGVGYASRTVLMLDARKGSIELLTVAAR